MNVIKLLVLNAESIIKEAEVVVVAGHGTVITRPEYRVHRRRYVDFALFVDDEDLPKVDPTKASLLVIKYLDL